MECRLGVKLVERSRSGVCPTDAGIAFLRSARRVMDEIETMTQSAKAFGRVMRGTIRIGIFWPVVCGFLADLLQAYSGANPEVRPELIEAWSAPGLRPLASRRSRRSSVRRIMLPSCHSRVR